MLPVVLIHGWASQPQVWQPLINALPSYKAINLSLPAYNNAGDWQQPISYLQQQLPARCHVVGWSLGGNVAMALAKHAPEHVASVTTIATAPCFVANEQWPYAMAKTNFEQFSVGIKTAPAISLKRFAALQAKGASNERDVVKTLRQLVLTAPYQALVESLQWLGDTHQGELWNKLTIPQLHVFGEGDALLPDSAAEHCKNAIVIANAGHAPLLSQPHKLAAALTDFWNTL